jgi:hypothetical protein
MIIKYLGQIKLEIDYLQLFDSQCLALFISEGVLWTFIISYVIRERLTKD